MEKMTVEQFIRSAKDAGVDYKELHVHHTYIPDHGDFNGTNGMRLQENMRRYHVEENGWSDIAQHGTILPDGYVITGRPFDQNPASILGENDGNPLMIEMVGNFDQGNDTFEDPQKQAMIKVAKWFHGMDKYIRFHRENSDKSCPGTGIDKDDFMKRVTGEKTESEGDDQVIIRKGDSGSHVEKYQKKVMRAGHDLPEFGADGKFGDETKNAVRSFQEEQEIQVDGIIGPETIGKLREVLAEKGESPDLLYKVQIGAFEDKDNAKNLMDELKGKGFDVYLVKEE